MLNTLLTAWASIIILMLLAWLSVLWKKNPAIIDVFWAIAITTSAFIFCRIDTGNMAKLALQALLFVWAARLSGYLFLKRILPGHIDKRYIELSKDWSGSKNLGFLANFQLQGILAIIIATPFIFISQLESTQISSYLAMAMVVIGIVGESIADLQLQRFNKNTQKGVCDIGLWKYCRHPNYFFEWIIWLGFSVAGLSVHMGWLGLCSPLSLLLIMTMITGPLTEKGSIKSRGNSYIAYQKKTSMFVPWPTKKHKE